MGRSFIVKHEPKEYVPCPEGLHQAVACDLVDLGTVDGMYGPKPKLRLYWQIPDQINPETKKPFIVAKQYTVSLHEKAALRKDLETWRGRRFTKEELSKFDMEKLMGVNCQVQIVHSTSDDGRVFANVETIIPIRKGDQTIDVKDYERKSDRERNERDGFQNAGAARARQASGERAAANAEREEAQPSTGGYDDDVPF